MQAAIEKITGKQLSLLLFTFIISTNLLTVPSFMVMFAKQDAWISALLAAVTGLVSIWTMITLANRYPGQTIIEYSSAILGKWLGSLVAVNYIYYWLISISTITMQHTGFINTLLLPKSPTIVTSLTFLILCGIAASLGIEVIARSSEFLTLLLLVCFVPLLILSIMEANANQIKPILDDGIYPVLQGALSPAGGFMNQLFILGWLLPYLNQPGKARKASMIALIGITFLTVSIVMLTIMIFGPLTSKLTYSFLSVVQYIGIEGSLERLEAIAVSTWVIGCFVKVAVSVFILSLCVSQLFGIRNYRDLVPPLTLLSLVGSVWIFKNSAELLHYLAFTFPLLAFFNHTFIPFLLLVIDSIKRKTKRSLL
ncbi:endospore germination permease [Paenibacillus glycanilyticus]|uniref:GerAB/ArcD/ProY family transporter n=1 Tax=Paenibacillus glycanilyticus TaxID=126569 RepID=UPI00203BADC2|nr:endospore germination permease [Paenibacillus glycanilyticus]MCM3628312.1 endospore germination permease [Paenibacillus glycanilyticus]